ncbi:MAG: hypothetical protein D6702_01185 [Planctomycetota bacterium]|nr:MAG: hypothetical protein D6702_01185 [Planctomycetota bacterium]
MSAVLLLLLASTVSSPAQDPPRPSCPNKQVHIEQGTLSVYETIECDDGLTSFSYGGRTITFEDESCLQLIWTPPLHTIIDGTGLTFLFDELALPKLVAFKCEDDLCLRDPASDSILSGNYPQDHTVPCP